MSGGVEIIARYRVVTPLFCGGADPTATTAAAELRLPSFKGVLRFWWRALAWSHYQADLAAIRGAEDELFGSGGSGARRSRVVMRLVIVSGHAQRTKGTVLQDARDHTVGQGARYLGYGVMESFDRSGRPAGQLLRPCLVQARRDIPFEFEIHLRCRGVDAPTLELFRRALEIMGMVGGLGARSRRGYGSVALTKLTIDGSSDWKPPASMVELKERIAALTAPASHTSLPQYTAFSPASRFVLLHASRCRDALMLLDHVGREMVRHRSYGKDGRILVPKHGEGIQAEQNFAQDHDLALRVAGGGTPPSHPKRVAFGLPHNYYFSSTRQFVSIGPGGGRERRASPLFIHIHVCGASPVAVLSFLPAQFLPRDHCHPNRPPTIMVGHHPVPQLPESQIYEPVHDYLDRFVHGTHKEPFSQVEVLP